MTMQNAGELGPHIEAGHTLIPLAGKQKVPKQKNWLKRSYDNFDAAAHMAGGGNIGVRLEPGMIVVDVDPRNHQSAIPGGDFAELMLRLGLNPSGWPVVNTGSGGQHYYLKKPADVFVRNELAEYPGVEFKSYGRQVVAAGSVHPKTGNLYGWDEINCDPHNAPECPQDLLDLIAKPNKPANGKAQDDDGAAPRHTAEELEAMLGELDVGKFRPHDDWLELMMACHDATAGEGAEAFVAWSTSDPEYSDHGDDIRKRWGSLDENTPQDKVTYRTLYKILTDNGAGWTIRRTDAADDFDDEVELPEAAPAENSKPEGPKKSLTLVTNANGGIKDTFGNAVIAVRSINLDACFDELKHAVVFRSPKLPWSREKYGDVLNEDTLRVIRLYLVNKFSKGNYDPRKENVYEAVQTIAFGSKFNPVLEYLDGLAWDGTPRVERLFPGYFRTDDDPFTRAVSRCFLIAAVRRQRRAGCKFDTMPVLKGEQGVGKSSGIKALFGEDWFSDAELGNLNAKDAPMLLHGIWVQEFAELDGMRRSEANTLKAFLSRATDRYRAPYERAVGEVPRRCVFIGTGNESDYLSDQTGNRRFWPLEARGEVDLAALRSDRDQMWAEAAHLEARGEPVTLDRSLWGEAARRQQAEVADEPWADILTSYIQGVIRENEEYEQGAEEDAAKPRPCDKFHSAHLLRVLEFDASRRTQAISRRLKTVMTRELGWEYRRAVRIGDTTLAGFIAPERKK